MGSIPTGSLTGQRRPGEARTMGIQGIRRRKDSFAKDRGRRIHVLDYHDLSEYEER